MRARVCGLTNCTTGVSDNSSTAIARVDMHLEVCVGSGVMSGVSFVSSIGGMTEVGDRAVVAVVTCVMVDGCDGGVCG